MGSAAFRCMAKKICTTLSKARIMSKTTPEEAARIARDHKALIEHIEFDGKSDGCFIKITDENLAALIDEVVANASLRGVDAEPVHWRAVLAAHQVPKRLITDFHVVGFKKYRSAESWIAEQKDFGGWEYTLEPLYTHPAPSQPAAPVELPVVGWIRGSGMQMLKDGYAATLYVDERDSNNSMALVRLSDAQAAIAAGRKAS